MSPASCCFSVETSLAASPFRTVVLFQAGSCEGRGHDVLGLAVQPVRQGASPGWPPRGEELVAAPAQQHGLGAQRLIERDPGRLFAAPVANPADPAAVPETFVTDRVLDNSVERDVLADDDLSHTGSPLIGVVSYH